MRPPGGVRRDEPAEPASGGADLNAVGPRLRRLRQEAGISLRQLAQRSGLSVGFLSQVERGLSSIALTRLHEVAAALGVTMAEFFGAVPVAPLPDDDAVVFTVTRAAERRVVESSGQHFELLSARVPGLVLEPMLVHIPPGGQREPAAGHAGEEFAYVLSGELLYEVAGKEYRLGPGDSLFLRSNTPHSLYNDGAETTVVISVVTPRHY
jgi:transcriptional regulator with XRE-family HTH domain